MRLYVILLFLLALFVAKAVYNRVRAVILRASLYLKLSKICKKRGFSFDTPRPFVASMIKFSKKPDILIETGGERFIVRIVTCFARKRHYCFVSPEWFVRVFKLYLPVFAEDELAPFKRAKHIPPLDEKYLALGGRVVLLFNPSPLEITFAAAGSGREIASNGSVFDGMTIYNGKGFAEALEAAGEE